MKTIILVLFSACVAGQTNLTAPVTILPMPNHSEPGPWLLFDQNRFNAVGFQAPGTGIGSPTITAATAASPMVLTLSAAPPAYVQTGTEIVIVGATGAGCNSMNGVHPVSLVSGSTVTVTFNNVGCTYTASSGTVPIIWTLPTNDGTNALCGNSTASLSFTCSSIVVKSGANTIDVLNGNGIQVDQNKTITLIDLLNGETVISPTTFKQYDHTTGNQGIAIDTSGGGVVAVYDSTGTIIVDQLDSAGVHVNQNKTITLSDTLNGETVISPTTFKQYDHTTGNQGIAIDTSGGGLIAVYDSTGASVVDQIDYTGITMNSGTFRLGTITGSTQCLEVNSSGVVSGTGSVCGGSSPSFPASTSYTPTFGSWTASSTNAAYNVSGKLTFVRITSAGTFTGTSGTYMTVSLPSSVLSGTTQALAAVVTLSSGIQVTALGYASSGVVEIGPPSGFVNSTTYTVVVTGFYETN